MAAEKNADLVLMEAEHINSANVGNVSDHHRGKVSHLIGCSPLPDALNTYPIFENDFFKRVKNYDWESLLDDADREFAAVAHEENTATSYKGGHVESSKQDSIIYFLRESDGSKRKVEAWSPSGSHELIYNNISYADLIAWINFLKEPCANSLSSSQSQLHDAFSSFEPEVGVFDNPSATFGDPFSTKTELHNSVEWCSDQFVDVNLNSDSPVFMEMEKKESKFIDSSFNENMRNAEFTDEPVFLKQSDGAKLPEFLISNTGWNGSYSSGNAESAPFFGCKTDASPLSVDSEEPSWLSVNSAFGNFGQQFEASFDKGTLSHRQNLNTDDTRDTDSEQNSKKLSKYEKADPFDSPLVDPFSAFSNDIPLEQFSSKITLLQESDDDLATSNFDNLRHTKQ